MTPESFLPLVYLVTAIQIYRLWKTVSKVTNSDARKDAMVFKTSVSLLVPSSKPGVSMSLKHWFSMKNGSDSSTFS